MGLKVKGPDVAEVERLSQDLEAALREVPGTKYVLAERISEGYYVDVRNDLERMAEHGVTIDEAMTTIRYGVGGDNVLNAYPDEFIFANSNGGQLPYPRNSPFGFNGAFVYGKVGFRW